MEFYRVIFQTVADAKGAIGFAVLLFLAGAVIGALVPQAGQPFVLTLQEMAQELAGRPTADLALQIFLRNGVAAAVAIFGGIAFGLIPALAALGNGILAGAVLNLLPTEIWKILPHGLFELPAIFIAWGLGLWIGLWPAGSGRLRRLVERMIAAARVLLALLIPLLVIAALIEAFAAVHLYRSL